LDVEALVRETIDTLSPPDHIAVKIEGRLPTVTHDKTLLAQVFQNLIGNAIKHLGRPRGRVVVSHADLGDAWEFCVRDDGVGIEESRLEQIFNLFRAFKSPDDEESTGIGLSLVKRIVERIGGRVRVTSTPGAGSAFFFTLPKKFVGGKRMEKYTVLIIDDNSQFIKVATSMFERDGCNALRAVNGREANKILAEHDGKIHVALFDVDIPGEDPMERYRTIRKLRKETRIVACTGARLDEIVDQLKKEGVDGVLEKPFTMDELNQLLLEIEH
ncbi:MAG: response regulator, partial [Desulfobacterales bacterium]|nr:response regulator [Desulfobacterales bacterium]